MNLIAIRILIVCYITSGCLAYGHAYNNKNPSRNDSEHMMGSFMAMVISPAYWSIVIFEGDNK